MQFTIIVLIFTLPSLFAWGNPGCTVGLGVQVCSGVFIHPFPCSADELHISSTAVRIDLEHCLEGLHIVFHEDCPQQILNSPQGMKVHPEICQNMVSFYTLLIKFNMIPA